MPLLQGIEVTIVTQSELGQLPEYPHPDGSSFQSRRLRDNKPDDQSNSCDGDFQNRVADDPAHASGTDSTVSVYVPSLPGAQFWINYVVKTPPSPPGHLFFKLYMNGRHITSWGINPSIKSHGRAEKALYEPSDRWDQEEDGVVFKQEGIEARYFYFTGNQQELSAADNGGLIEVQAFRAKGRKRRAAKLDQYRVQDKYGITAPSGGLLDNPQDITFFDFHLIDPKDAPFATFRFHYRSWDSLNQLSLVPADDPSILESSVTSTVCDASELPPERDASAPEQVEPFIICPDPDESVFVDSTSSGDLNEPAVNKTRRNSSFVLRTPPELRPRSATSHNLPQPSKSLRDALPVGFPESYLSRPLPDRPLPDLPASVSPDQSWLPRSRKSSTASAAPSVAPSLRSYVKNESFLDETIEYGQAQEIHMDKKHPGVPLNQEKAALPAVAVSSTSDASTSDYDGSSLAENNSTKIGPEMLSPGNHSARTRNMLEEHTTRAQNQQAAANISSENPDIDFSRFPHLGLSESEWIRRTPSPQAVQPRRILSPRLDRLWKTLRRSKSRSPLRPFRNPEEEASRRNYSTPQLTSPEVKVRLGNWI